MGSEIFGVIAPHPPIMLEQVGGHRTSVTKASIEGMIEVAGMLADFDPDTVVVMSPHSPAISDAFAIETADALTGSLAQFGAPDAKFSYAGDVDLALQILGRFEEAGLPSLDRAVARDLATGTLDHGVLVPMSFLDPDSQWPLVVLSLSYLPLDVHWTAGIEIAAAARDLGKRIAFVASGDCSHRLTPDAPGGFSPAGRMLDEEIVEAIADSDFERLVHIDPELIDHGGECGLRSFITLGGAVGVDAHARVLSYEGPWGVGYLTAIVNEPTPDEGTKHGMPGLPEHEIVTLARHTIDSYVRDGKLTDATLLDDPDLPPRAGAFVTLHREGQLRGCIGTIAPVYDTLAEEIVRNAIQAATADPRFPRLGENELADLDIKVDVLHVPKPCTFDDLDPKDYGVIVTSAGKRGLLLPDLDGVDDSQTQVAIASRKAGIQPGEPIALERFKVDRYA